MTLRIVALVLLALASFPGGAAADDKSAGKQTDPLRLSLSAYVARAEGQVSVRMRVEPDPRSRELQVEWWNEEGVGGSTRISLEGERAATRHDVPLKRMAEGEYAVTALLLRADGTAVRRTARLVVVGANGPMFDERPILGGGDMLMMAPPLGDR